MTKRFAIAASITAFLTQAGSVLAQGPFATPTRPPVRRDPQDISITPPNVGYSNLGTFITAALQLVFVIAAIAVLIMLVWGALQWIFSGGEKDAVASARNRILHALIGLAVLAVAFAIAVVFGNFVGINLFDLRVPTPTEPTPFGAGPTQTR